MFAVYLCVCMCVCLRAQNGRTKPPHGKHKTRRGKKEEKKVVLRGKPWKQKATEVREQRRRAQTFTGGK